VLAIKPVVGKLADAALDRHGAGNSQLLATNEGLARQGLAAGKTGDVGKGQLDIPDAKLLQPLRLVGMGNGVRHTASLLMCGLPAALAGRLMRGVCAQ